MFANRTDAGRQLAEKLRHLAPQKPLALGLPRGGVLVAAEIARALRCDLDVLLVKKLRAPENPELAFGAVSEDGKPFLNEEVLRLIGGDEAYIDMEIRERLDEMAVQRRLYRAAKPKIPATGRVAVLVDDGLATGATMIAAAQAVLLENPRQLVVAVPVSSHEALAILHSMSEVDDVICLSVPDWFAGVGQFYKDFTQISDDEVVKILKEFA
jgi:putative phosphoribosyl transferase